MRNRTVMAVVLGLAGALTAAEEKPAAAPDTPAAVEVRLQDGSLLRGELTGLDVLTLKTAYGILQYPLARIWRVQVGSRTPPQDLGEVTATLKELDSDEYAVRTGAQQKLEALGPPALAALREAHANTKASAEARVRIDAVLKKMIAAGIKAPVDDAVCSEEFEALGRLQVDTLTLKNSLGNLQIKVDDIESIVWLNRGVSVNLNLDTTSALDEWIDTGVDPLPGTKLAIFCDGKIKLASQETGPQGTSQWNNSRPFMIGAVIGKFGSSGKPFLIGAAHQAVASSRERLFLKIHCPEEILPANQRKATGAFGVRIGTGCRAETTKTPSDPAPKTAVPKGPVPPAPPSKSDDTEILDMDGTAK